MLTGIKVQITAESSIVIGRLCCYSHFCPGQTDKLPEVFGWAGEGQSVLTGGILEMKMSGGRHRASIASVRNGAVVWIRPTTALRRPQRYLG